MTFIGTDLEAPRICQRQIPKNKWLKNSFELPFVRELIVGHPKEEIREAEERLMDYANMVKRIHDRIESEKPEST